MLFKYIKYIEIIILSCIFYKCNYNIFIDNKHYINKLIEENFFIIDSNNLENIKSHLYGFSVSKKGIITDNYYKNIGYYEEPDATGAFIMIRLIENEIKIIQDFQGSYGLYIYENKNKKYYALSNSFLKLEEYIYDKEKISFNKEFADNFIISWLCTPSLKETMIKEITRIPSNAVLYINKKTKLIKINYIDYNENTIPLESKEGLKIVDDWVDKWSFIMRSINNIYKDVYYDLSGGFDTRLVLAILLSSGLNIKNIQFHSTNKKVHGHEEDYKIAKNISLLYGFKLNNIKYNDKNFTKWNLIDIIYCSIYSKLGFHKEFYLKNKFYNIPKFSFTGDGGEYIRGIPGFPIEKYLDLLSSKGRGITQHENEFYNSSMRLIKRSIAELRKKTYNNHFEISSDLYSRYQSNHFGKKAIEGFISNYYYLEPLIDPDIRKINYNISAELSHDLIAYIYIRFGHSLIYFPFQGNRSINYESIKKAEKLNKLLSSYEIKSDYNNNFYIDFERKSPVSSSPYNISVENYLKKFFNSKYFIECINNIYDLNVYNWAKEYSIKSNFFPFRHLYGLLAIFMTKEFLIENEKFMKNLYNHKYFNEHKNTIINILKLYK